VLQWTSLAVGCLGVISEVSWLLVAVTCVVAPGPVVGQGSGGQRAAGAVLRNAGLAAGPLK
jgi:hypothetical protein